MAWSPGALSSKLKVPVLCSPNGPVPIVRVISRLLTHWSQRGPPKISDPTYGTPRPSNPRYDVFREPRHSSFSNGSVAPDEPTLNEGKCFHHGTITQR